MCTVEEVYHYAKESIYIQTKPPVLIIYRVIMLKATARSLAPSLTNLFNLTISLGTFPAKWKIARAV